MFIITLYQGWIVGWSRTGTAIAVRSARARAPASSGWQFFAALNVNRSSPDDSFYFLSLVLFSPTSLFPPSYSSFLLLVLKRDRKFGFFKKRVWEELDRGKGVLSHKVHRLTERLCHCVVPWGVPRTSSSQEPYSLGDSEQRVKWGAWNLKSENPVPAAGVPAWLASVLSLVIDRAAPSRRRLRGQRGARPGAPSASSAAMTEL